MGPNWRLSCEIGLFFGWLLAIPLFGPLWHRAAQLRAIQIPHHAFLLVHAVSLVLLGWWLARRWPDRLHLRLLSGASSLCALLTLGLMVGPTSWAAWLLAAMAIPASLYILIWVSRFALLPAAQRPRTIAGGMFIANILYGLALLVSVRMSLVAIAVWSLAMLMGPVLWPPQAMPGAAAGQASPSGEPDSRRLVKLSVAILLCYVAGGLYYAVTLSRLDPEAVGTNLIPVLCYLLALGGALWLLERVELRVLALASVVGLGMGYGWSALWVHPTSQLMAHGLIHASLAGLDMFVWLGLARYRLSGLGPTGAYGWGLGANVTGLLIGSHLAYFWLARSPQDLATASALVATLVLFIAVLALVEISPPRAAPAVESPHPVELPLHLQAKLTTRQVEVARLMLQGRENQEIERDLFISANTAKSHVRQIYRRLGVHNRQDLLLLALREQEAGWEPRTSTPGRRARVVASQGQEGDSPARGGTKE